MSEADLRFQTWIVRASLTTACGDRSPREDRINIGPQIPATGDFLAAGEAIGQWLEERAIRKGGGASWLTMALDANPDAARDRHFRLQVIGDDLYEGLAGVVYTLAYLGHVTQERRYEALAREGLQTLSRRESSRPPTQVGAFTGLGGRIFLLTHLGALWTERRLLDEAGARLDALDRLAVADRRFDVISGVAGCIPVLLGLHGLHPGSQALTRAVRYGEQLLRLTRVRGKREAFFELEIKRGFSHGAAGLAHALALLFTATGEEKFERGALRAMRFEEVQLATKWTDIQDVDEEAQSTWCHGAAGIALGRLALFRMLGREEAKAAALRALEVAKAAAPLRAHALCHGRFGNLEAWRVAARVFPTDPQWQLGFEAEGRVLLEELRRGCASTLPNQVETPGPMLGMAGIGLGLLRCAAPGLTPSVLLLEGPQATFPPCGRQSGNGLAEKLGRKTPFDLSDSGPHPKGGRRAGGKGSA